jgi:hypothetical protein
MSKNAFFIGKKQKAQKLFKNQVVVHSLSA